MHFGRRTFNGDFAQDDLLFPQKSLLSTNFCCAKKGKRKGGNGGDTGERSKREGKPIRTKYR